MTSISYNKPKSSSDIQYCTLYSGFLQLVTSRTHPGGIQSPGIQGLWGSIVVNDGHAIGVSHRAEDGQLRLRDRLHGHEVGPEHSLVTRWSCQASLMH